MSNEAASSTTRKDADGQWWKQDPGGQWHAVTESEATGKKPKTRKFTWFILAVNVLFLVWIIAGISSSATTPAVCDASLTQEACDAARGIGTTLGVGLIIAFWAFADFILLVLWLVTRKRGR